MNIKQFAILTTQLSFFALAISAPIAGEEKVRQTFMGPISITDPDKDCEFLMTGDRLKIAVPATNHDLCPYRAINAPRVLMKVGGDFTIQLKVTSDLEPGRNSTRNGGEGTPFNGAGILIWSSEDNFLRIERNAQWRNNSLFCYPPLTEYWLNGQCKFGTTGTTEEYFKGGATWLKAQRRGNDVIVSISHDGKEWNQVKTIQLEMEKEVSVGVDAINSSDKPFAVEFSELKIKSE